MVGKDDDSLDESLDTILVKGCDLSFLLVDEVLQLLDPVHSFFPAVAVDSGLFRQRFKEIIILIGKDTECAVFRIRAAQAQYCFRCEENTRGADIASKYGENCIVYVECGLRV